MARKLRRSLILGSRCIPAASNTNLATRNRTRAGTFFERAVNAPGNDPGDADARQDARDYLDAMKAKGEWSNS